MIKYFYNSNKQSTIFFNKCFSFYIIIVFFGFLVFNIIKKIYSYNVTFLSLYFCNINDYDVILNTDVNLFDLVKIILTINLLIFLLLGQAKLLNLSFFPNATFDSEKYSPYECGFAPFRTERAQFDIKFYLVALLFLVFDVELMFLLPFCMSYFYLDSTGYLIFLIFFLILLIGFLVEWSAGMLVWKNEKLKEKEKKEKLKNNLIVNYMSFLDYAYLEHLKNIYRHLSVYGPLMYRAWGYYKSKTRFAHEYWLNKTDPYKYKLYF